MAGHSSQPSISSVGSSMANLHVGSTPGDVDAVNGIHSTNDGTHSISQASAPPHLRAPSMRPEPGDLNFSESLWDQFDLVYARITKGRHDLKHLKTYMDDRATLERIYAKALQKAVDTNLLDLEAPSPTYIEPWNDVKQSSASLGKQHDDFAQVCVQISALLKDWINELKAAKTKLQNDYTRLVKDKEAKKLQHDKSRTVYVQAVKAAEEAFSTREASRNKVADKAFQKLEQKVRDTAKNVNTTHEAYKRSVDGLVDSQKRMDVDIIVIMQDFQKLETQRLQNFQLVLNNFTQIHINSQKNMQTIADFMQKSVSAIDVRQDVQTFIQQHKTGKPHEAYATYIPQTSTLIGHAVGANALQPSMTSPNGMPMQQNPHTPISAATIPTAPITPHQQASAPSPVASTGAAATALALYDFAPSEEDELPFKAGEVVHLTKWSDGEDWWNGTVNGRTGLFPKNYVAKMNQQTGQYVGVDGVVHQPPALYGSGASPAAAAVEPATQAAESHAGPTMMNAGGEAEAPKLMNATCTALYDFEGQDADELTFQSGQKLIITGELNGWFLGRLESENKIGIFPSNYVSLDTAPR